MSDETRVINLSLLEECLRLRARNADLLAALEELLVWCKVPKPLDPSTPYKRAYEQARAAVASAKGEA